MIFPIPTARIKPNRNHALISSHIIVSSVVLDVCCIDFGFLDGPVHEAEEHKTENEDAKD